MTAEQELIPFSAMPLRGERLLVLAPHPDDEVIGCGGLLRQHAAERRLARVIVVTDGVEARQEGADGEAYRTMREDESRKGLEVLGISDVRFLGLRDRTLGARRDELRAVVEREIGEFHPDLVLAPAPTEIHPDHLALSRAVVDAIHASSDLVPDLALTRIAFYEVSQPIRPNVLVDITADAEVKFAAVEAHFSQTAIRNYRSYSEGLNQYRAMTLGAETRYAEGYYVIDAEQIRTTPFTELSRQVSGSPAPVELVREPIPISVIVRTKNRPAWLAEAVASIAANSYPADVVVVNDGGSSPAEALRDFTTRISLVEHETSRGRSEAMNAGVRAAGGELIAFLDDDDVYYPEHLATLVSGISSSGYAAVYTDAVSSFMAMGDDGRWVSRSRLRLYARDFDPGLLRFENYIPLPTILVHRSDFLDAGGFDPQFDLFEDWDFLIRLSARGSFVRIPRVTCEIRHYEGSGSAILSAPAGSAAFRQAKLRVWEKHGVGADPNEIADALESEKRAASRLFERMVESGGRGKHLQLDVDRLERDKKDLLDQLGSEHSRHLEAAEQARVLADEILAVHAAREELERRASELERLKGEAESSLATWRALAEQRDESLRATFAEIERLNALLRSIYSSRTWKLHQTLESLKGKH